MSSIANKREKDAKMARMLAPSPVSHRHKPETWPYHNNLGTTHKREKKEEKPRKL